MRKNTIIILILVFLFRTVLVALNSISYDFNQKHIRLSTLDASTAVKKSAFLDKDSNEYLKVFPIVELTEEETENEENHIKSDTPIILFFVLSIAFIASLIQKVIASFDVIKCHLFPKKYLSLSILRL